MKRILFFAAVLLALVGNTTTLSAQDIEQESITLTQRNIQEILLATDTDNRHRRR